MKTYIKMLKVASEKYNREVEKTKPKDANRNSRILCNKPLTQQITELMATLPPAQKNRPWSMDELVSRLQGHYSTWPHPMNVGKALRALGWHQKRDWTNNGGGRRVWIRPPKI